MQGKAQFTAQELQGMSLFIRADKGNCAACHPVTASADGTPRVAVTTLNEKNGWLSLSASGFEFSTPRIAIKLEQHNPVFPQTKPVIKKITCVKGKITKVVTTSACPAGFKKK